MFKNKEKERKKYFENLRNNHPFPRKDEFVRGKTDGV